MVTLVVRTAATAAIFMGLVAAAGGQTFPIQKSGSDSRSRTFNSRVLPAAQTLLAGKLGEGVTYTVALGERLDASRMYLRYDSSTTVRVYILNAVTSCTNRVGVFVKKTGASGQGSPITLFPAVSSAVMNQPNGLARGDFVDIGQLPAGTQLDPYFMSTCYKPPITWYSDPSRNNDNQPHVTSFLLDDRYLIVGFEDWTDYDYQDAVIVCDLGSRNALAFEKPKLAH